MRNLDLLKMMAEEISAKHSFVPLLDKILMAGYFERHFCSAPELDISEAIYERGQIVERSQPEKISEALKSPKEQMLIRDHHRPEYFIWSLELKEDEQQFGFVRQAHCNKFEKTAVNLSFRRASDLFFEYFNIKVPVSAIDISAFSRGEK